MANRVLSGRLIMLTECNKTRLRSFGRATLIVATIALSLTGATRKHTFSSREKAFYADPALVQFVRPGLVFQVASAAIASDGTITATLSIADSEGLPLDRLGVGTPGAVAASLIAATIPRDKDQYTSYTTRSQKSPITNVTAIQAGADAGGIFTKLSDGVYQYTFATKAPAGFDAAATHTIGVYGSRNLTAFRLGTNYASTTFNFVPNGSAVTKVRDVVKTSGCNGCHDQLSFHGGSRRGIETCVLCHTPQTVDPDTGNTVDLKVMVHKIHMGSSLPSVIAGKPYQVIGFGQSVSDWSSVVYPADVRRCETCHEQGVKAKQALNYVTKPTREACGSCHDDINFASGEKHAGGPQVSDNQCATCHIAQGEIDFDASIQGAHVIPTESSLLSGLNVAIVKVDNGVAGKAPLVSFTVKDNAGNGVPTSALGFLSFTMGGADGDYAYVSFGSDVTTPGYVTESAMTAAKCAGDGSCTYQFVHAIPAGITGTVSIGAESRRTEVLLAGTTKQQSVTYGAKNPVFSFASDQYPMVPRRTVVATANCNGCHVALSAHGTLRNQVEYCVMCHNPSNTDAGRRVAALNPADKAAKPQGVNFNLLVHRIHTGEGLTAAGRPYVVVGFGGTHNDFSDVRYPAFNASGAPGDTRNCAMCHVGGSEQNLPDARNVVLDPQGPIPQVQPITAACTGCHVTLPAAGHALSNSNILGESCSVCHGANGAYAVGQVHAQY